MSLTAIRFRLEPYSGPKSRSTCPACQKTRVYTRYIDTETGEILPEEYGRCDREANCGYSLSPYTRPAGGGLSYATATERGEQVTTQSGAVARRLVVLPSAPIVSIPSEVYQASLGGYDRNALALLLRQHFGWGVAQELLTRFHIGTSAYWPGACVFWLLDEVGRVRGGQVVLYDASGHTVKTPERHTRWAHTALAERYRQRGEEPPTWLADYQQHGQKSPCLFGLPQLSSTVVTQPIALVESAKTAVLCTPYMPQYCWLATMGLSYLTTERLNALRGRRIVLFPDAGALQEWQQRADILRQQGFDIQVSSELEALVTAEERAAGLDLADVLLMEWPGYPPSWDDSLPG